MVYIYYLYYLWSYAYKHSKVVLYLLRYEHFYTIDQKQILICNVMFYVIVYLFNAIIFTLIYEKACT